MSSRLGKGFLLASLLSALAAGCGGSEGEEATAKQEAALTIVPKGTIKLDQSRYRARPATGAKELVVVTVADADLDLDPAVRDTVQVTIGVAGSKVQAERVKLTESDVSTAVFATPTSLMTFTATVLIECAMACRTRTGPR